MIISIVLFILCTLGAILIVLQSMMGAIVQLYLWVPVVIMLLIAFIKSIIDYKKNKKAIKYTSKKEQLYSIINNTQKYHKIITDDKYIDLIFISSFGIMTINVLSILPATLPKIPINAEVEPSCRSTSTFAAPASPI